jgi:hypothetical protein
MHINCRNRKDKRSQCLFAKEEKICPQNTALTGMMRDLIDTLVL